MVNNDESTVKSLQDNWADDIGGIIGEKFVLLNVDAAAAAIAAAVKGFELVEVNVVNEVEDGALFAAELAESIAKVAAAVAGFENAAAINWLDEVWSAAFIAKESDVVGWKVFPLISPLKYELNWEAEFCA